MDSFPPGPDKQHPRQQFHVTPVHLVFWDTTLDAFFRPKPTHIGRCQYSPKPMPTMTITHITHILCIKSSHITSTTPSCYFPSFYKSVFQPSLWSGTFSNNFGHSRNLMRWYKYRYCCTKPSKSMIFNVFTHGYHDHNDHKDRSLNNKSIFQWTSPGRFQTLFNFYRAMLAQSAVMRQ